KGDAGGFRGLAPIGKPGTVEMRSNAERLMRLWMRLRACPPAKARNRFRRVDKRSASTMMQSGQNRPGPCRIESLPASTSARQRQSVDYPHRLSDWRSSVKCALALQPPASSLYRDRSAETFCDSPDASVAQATGEPQS